MQKILKLIKPIRNEGHGATRNLSLGSLECDGESRFLQGTLWSSSVCRAPAPGLDLCVSCGVHFHPALELFPRSCCRFGVWLLQWCGCSPRCSWLHGWEQKGGTGWERRRFYGLQLLEATLNLSFHMDSSPCLWQKYLF